jgi:uncharacterized protein
VTARLAIRVQPRAKRTEVAGERAGAVLVRVAAPPVDGRANAAVCTLVAQRAGVRDKVLEVRGIEPADLRRALGLDA